MMPIDFAAANVVFGKPDSMTDEQCLPISAYVEKNEKDFITRIVTVWKPNKEDIEAILRGEPIYVSICGGVLPPMALYTVDQNNQINE